MFAYQKSIDGFLLVGYAGERENDAKVALRELGGRFVNGVGEDGRLIERVWEFKYARLEYVYGELQKLEPHGKPELMKPKKKADVFPFVRWRGYKLDPALVKSEFKGEYQEQTVLHGISQNRLAIFHRQGKGKSFIIQTIMNHLIERGSIERYVIVCPPEGVYNLANECIRFASFPLTMGDIYIVSTASRNPFSSPRRITILSYSGIRMLYDDAYKARKGASPSDIVTKDGKRRKRPIIDGMIPFDKLGGKLALILDESSEGVKNDGNKTYKVVAKSTQYFEYRYLMTGTPTPRDAADLWTQFHLLDTESVPPSLDDFLEQIANVSHDRWGNSSIASYKEGELEKWFKSVEYLVERNIDESDLPPLRIEPVYCRMPPLQAQIYQTLATETLGRRVAVNGQLTLKQIKNCFMDLCIALHDPSIISENPDWAREHTDPYLRGLLDSWKFELNGKLQKCRELVNGYIAEGHKVILWSGHPMIIDSLALEFQAHKPLVVHGGTGDGESSASRNARIVNQFSATTCPLLIASYKCLKTSVNITCATRAVYIDRSFMFSDFYQSLKRIHRIGQTQKVIINPLIFYGTIEEWQDRTICKRRDFDMRLWADSSLALDKEDENVTLSADELREILRPKLPTR